MTLAEHDGIAQDETIEDTDWLQLCGKRGWLVLMKDDRIRYVAAERHALVESRVRAAVTITNANLPALEMMQRIIRALTDLAEISRVREGPFRFALQQNRIDEIPLD